MGKWDIRERVCRICGRVYEGAAYKRKFCSDECAFKNSELHKPVEKVCFVCGRKFIVNAASKETRHTCSRVCGGKFRTKPRPICKVCGKECKTGRTYCSIECRSAGRRKIKNKVVASCPICGCSKSEKSLFCMDCHFKNLKEKRKSVCKQCGNEFFIPAGKGTGKYCSQECSRLAMSRRYTLTCKFCGKDFEVQAAHKARKFCSQECSWNYSKQSGEKHSGVKKKRERTKSGVFIRPSTRLSVFDRDGFKCVYCGSGPPESKLVIDHVYPVSKLIEMGYSRPEINDEINLCTCCDLCNSGKLDKQLTKLPNAIRERILERIKSFPEVERPALLN